MLTEKDYCDYKTCIALDGLGCPVPKYATINIHTKERGWKMWISLYDAQKWLREEKHIEVVVLSRGMIGAPYFFQVYTEDYVSIDDKDYASFEEALSEGVRASIEILQDEQKENN